MAHLVETMAYNGATGTPWHGLGESADFASMTLDETIEIGGIDWPVELWQASVTSPDGVTLKCDDRFAVVRPFDGTIFNFVKKRYNPIQNREIVEFFREFCESGEMRIETLGALKGGAVIWCLAHINHNTDFTLAGGDKVKGYVLITMSHDGSVGYVAFLTSVRVVCMNTLRMAFGDKKGEDVLFRMRQSSKTERRKAVEKEAKASLAKSIGAMARMKETAEMLASCKVDFESEDAKAYVYSVISKGGLLESAVTMGETNQALAAGGNVLDIAMAQTEVSQNLKSIKDKSNDIGKLGKDILDCIVNSPGSDMVSAKNTAWGLLNGVTNYYDHHAGRSRDTALTSAWFGAGNTAKETALVEAIKLAERIGA